MFELGVAVHRLRRFEEAVGSYRRAIDLATPQTAPYSNLGLAGLDLGRYDDALHAQQTAVRHSPGNALYRGNLAECLWMAFGDVPRAEQELREAVALSPQAADLWAYLGRVLLSQGKDEEARAALEQAARNPLETSPWLPLRQAAAGPDPRAGDATECFRVALERASQPKPRALAMSGFGWAECGALALAGLGRADEAQAVLAASVTARCGADLFQRTVYERLAAVMPAGALDGVLEVWGRHLHGSDRRGTLRVRRRYRWGPGAGSAAGLAVVRVSVASARGTASGSQGAGVTVRPSHAGGRRTRPLRTSARDLTHATAAQDIHQLALVSNAMTPRTSASALASTRATTSRMTLTVRPIRPMRRHGLTRRCLCGPGSSNCSRWWASSGSLLQRRSSMSASACLSCWESMVKTASTPLDALARRRAVGAVASAYAPFSPIPGISAGHYGSGLRLRAGLVRMVRDQRASFT